MYWIDAGASACAFRGVPASALLPPPAGLERIARRAHLPRHRHRSAFAAIVLAGGYRESGDAGRFEVGPGDVLVHAAFEAHDDRLSPAGASVLNLPVPPALAALPRWRIADPDALAVLAARDPRAALLALAAGARPCPDAFADWPDLLARRLRSLHPFRLGEWAEAHGLAPATVSRGFRKAYGVTAHLYRAEARARRAVSRIRAGVEPLAGIAADLGFSDQPHMTRAVRAVSGRTPGEWRSGPAGEGLQGCRPGSQAAEAG